MNGIADATAWVAANFAAADAAVTEAEGRNKIALAKCEALSGRSQQACRDTANAALEMAKAKAKTMKAEHNQ